MDVPANLLEAHDALGAWNILLAWRGSMAHGTYTPSSDPDTIDDKDLIGVAVPPPAYYLGLREFNEDIRLGGSLGRRGTAEVMEGEWDAVVYEARKAVHLLRKGNPNVLALLWVPEELIVTATPAGMRLIECRELFAVRETYKTFLGYAENQRWKMTSGSEYQGYMGAKRRELVERFGYDTKNASHLIRILRQGAEFLRTGDLQVTRPDALELVAIKKGEWSKERVLEEAEQLMGDLSIAEIVSPLPDRIDSDRVDELAREVVETALGER